MNHRAIKAQYFQCKLNVNQSAKESDNYFAIVTCGQNRKFLCIMNLRRNKEMK